MATFFTSDLHIGHLNIITFCNRPYRSVTQMNADLVARWNEVVSDGDDVIVVGDVAMGRLEESLAYVEKLNGSKVLIPGNHDRMFGTQGTRYREQCERYLGAGFDEILEPTVEVELPDGTIALVCHFPYLREDEEDRVYEGRFSEMRPVDSGALLIHGHQHGMWRRKDRMIDVGVDAWGGFPVSAEVVVATFTSAKTDLLSVPWEPREEARHIAS